MLKAKLVSFSSPLLDSFELAIETFKTLSDQCLHVPLLFVTLLDSHVIVHSGEGRVLALKGRWVNIYSIDEPDVEGEREQEVRDLVPCR